MRALLTPYILGLTALYITMLYFQCRAFVIEKLPEKKADATAKAFGITIAYFVFLAQNSKVEAANMIVNTQATEQQSTIKALEARLIQCNEDGIKNRDFMVRLMDRSREKENAQPELSSSNIVKSLPDESTPSNPPASKIKLQLSSKAKGASGKKEFSKPIASLPKIKNTPQYDTTTKAPTSTGRQLISSKTGEVRGYVDSRISVAKGQRVVISAVGSISVGSFVGISGPDGRESGVLGLPLTQYNIAKNFKHAALLYKIGENSSWSYCGGNCDFIAEQSGTLIFNINDIDTSNNEGRYQITIKVFE
ncbi:MAG: hypothetical protein ACRYG7_15800 [Janthinobacterium lividum]